jgi:hypothetical protein
MKQAVIVMTLFLINGAPIKAKKQANPIEISIQQEGKTSFIVSIAVKGCESLKVNLVNFSKQITLRQEIYSCEDSPVKKVYKNETEDRIGLVIEAAVYGKIVKKNAILDYRNQQQQNFQADSPPFIELPAAD